VNCVPTEQPDNQQKQTAATIANRTFSKKKKCIFQNNDPCPLQNHYSARFQIKQMAAVRTAHEPQFAALPTHQVHSALRQGANNTGLINRRKVHD
jgi:hypothetical protein